MGFGDTSLVFAGHAVIIVGFAAFICRMVPMAAAARRAEVDYGALCNFPVCVMLFGVVAAMEAIYYGAARLLTPYL